MSSMKRILHYCVELFLMIIAYLITIAPLIIIFLALYLMKYLIFPRLPFIFFLAFFYIGIIIYEKIKKFINKD